MSPGPQRRTGRRESDRERYRKLAREAAIRGRELAEAGKLEDAKRVAAEAEQWERKWREHGGTGPLT